MHWLLLFLAGIGAGLTGSIGGLASIVSYPALLAAGLTPVAANVTNTVSLVANGIGSVPASRPELVGQRARARRLLPVALVGGLAGGVLLLLTPSTTFALLVPFLIAGAAIAILLPRPQQHHEGAADSRWLPWGIAGVAVYAGYFGAAAAVAALAMLLHGTPLSLPRANAMRNVLMFAANGIAAVYFVVRGGVHWEAAFPLACGLYLGGRLGPAVVRRAPHQPLRIGIGIAGLAMAAYLLVQALTR